MISKPDSPLTRPNLISKFRKISNEHFALDLSEFEEEEI